MGSTVDRVWTDVRDRVGEDLRDQYTRREDRAIVDDTVVRQLGLFDTERRFEAGELEANVHVFEEAWIIAWPDDLPSKSGLIVSTERDGDVATVGDVEWCLDYLNGEVDPSLDR
jgi:hypothetical protein